MPVQITAMGKHPVCAEAVTRALVSSISVVNVALSTTEVRPGPKAGRSRSEPWLALPTRALRRGLTFSSACRTSQAPAMSCSSFVLRAGVLRRAVSSSGRPSRSAFSARSAAGRQDKCLASGARSTGLVWRSSSTILGYSSPTLVSATNTPPPNMALQPTANGLPRLGLHFILAQTRQPVVCG